MAALAALPIGRAITIVWQVAREGGVAPEHEGEAAQACLSILRLYQSASAGPLLIAELDIDSPLLYAWLRACEHLWSKGLERLMVDGRWRVMYVPTYPNG